MVAVVFLSVAFVKAATVVLQPVADTTLIETAPNNNMGGTGFVNAGTAGSSGGRNRGLFKFDLSSIPRNSKITSATLHLGVIQSPDTGAQSSLFTLRRMLRNWGEGNKDSTQAPSPGLGLPAEINEATWNSPFALTTNSWSAPGAANDFISSASSSAPVDPLSAFPIFNSTTQMVSDAQLWTVNPSTNFGWLLKTESENIARTARRFGSREFAGIDTNSPPFVEITFVPPPVLNSLTVTNGQFRFSFFAETNQTYLVQFRTSLATTNIWQTFTNIPAQSVATNLSISDSISTNVRFYRVAAP